MQQKSNRYIGILPCGGRQTRMSELVFSKELLPLLDGRPVVQHSIDAMHRVTDDIVAFVHYRKKDLVTYLKKQGVAVVTGTSKGLPDSISRAAITMGNYHSAIFALPDTYYLPEDVFEQLMQHRSSSAIGLYHTETAERFDSVKMHRDRIVEYAVKCDPPLSNWTMGCGKVSRAHMSVFEAPHHQKDEYLIGDCFQQLVSNGELYGVRLADSSYYDLGTPQTYIEYVMKRFG